MVFISTERLQAYTFTINEVKCFDCCHRSLYSFRMDEVKLMWNEFWLEFLLLRPRCVSFICLDIGVVVVFVHIWVEPLSRFADQVKTLIIIIILLRHIDFGTSLTQLNTQIRMPSNPLCEWHASESGYFFFFSLFCFVCWSMYFLSSEMIYLNLTSKRILKANKSLN